VRRARESKPVVVSMADTAASGGYYVASGADAIVAEPATLTGSIGVFLLRPSFAGLYSKLDIGVEVIARGRHAPVAGSDLPLDGEQRARTATYVQSTYRDFLRRISEGRGTDVDELDRLGRGYVWLGSAALENGLVDALGGLHEAVELAKERAGIPADIDPARPVFPGPRSLGEQIREVLRGDLSGHVRRALLPFELPEPLVWAWLARDSEIAYLPTHWIEIR
jgi:protease-4